MNLLRTRDRPVRNLSDVPCVSVPLLEQFVRVSAINACGGARKSFRAPEQVASSKKARDCASFANFKINIRSIGHPNHENDIVRRIAPLKTKIAQIGEASANVVDR